MPVRQHSRCQPSRATSWVNNSPSRPPVALLECYLSAGCSMKGKVVSPTTTFSPAVGQKRFSSTPLEAQGARGGGWTCEGRFIGRSASQPRVRGKREVERGKNRKRQYGGTGAATSVDSHPGPRDASVVRSARAKAGYHRRCPSDIRGRCHIFGKWPSPQRRLTL